MPSSRRLSIKLKRDEALRITRAGIGRRKQCYIIVADKKLKYPQGRSKIVYIGTTKKGIGRLANSAANKVEDVFELKGVRSMTVHVVSCRGVQGVKTWGKLERALLLAFKEHYGTVPRFNTQGKAMKPRDEFTYFRKARLLRILEDLA